jgi:hypothetical protein
MTTSRPLGGVLRLLKPITEMRRHAIELLIAADRLSVEVMVHQSLGWNSIDAPAFGQDAFSNILEIANAWPPHHMDA